VIGVVVLQSGMDLVNGELGPCSGTGGTSTVGGNEVIGGEAERVTDVKKENQQTTTVPVMKTEPKVTAVLR
jgi:hypothetical protein